MSTRRNFLAGILAASAAPSIVKAESLMPIWTPPTVLWMDGVHDDADALEKWSNGQRVLGADGLPVGLTIRDKDIHISRPVYLFEHWNGGPKKETRVVIYNSFFVGESKTAHERRKSVHYHAFRIHNRGQA